MDTKGHVPTRDRTTGLKVSNRFGFNIQYNLGGSIWPFNEYENPRFDNEHDIHTTSNIYEESYYGLIYIC